MRSTIARPEPTVFTSGVLPPKRSPYFVTFCSTNCNTTVRGVSRPRVWASRCVEPSKAIVQPPEPHVPLTRAEGHDAWNLRAFVPPAGAAASNTSPTSFTTPTLVSLAIIVARRTSWLCGAGFERLR